MGASTAKEATIDVNPHLLRSRGREINVSNEVDPLTRIVIDRLTTIIQKRNDNELKNFLSREKGFRSDQYDYYSLLIHYVAGREFGTAEEADEWLTYAYVQKTQDIELESEFMRLRPLHYACKWGNIFGVEWLVTKGANINAKDAWRRYPYYFACASSVDIIKKMICLEEHGYILSPSEIIWASEIHFSSFDKANEVFLYLVNGKRLSVNTTDSDGDTPLHHACLNGNIFGVKWLIEHRADIHSVNKRGTTPFMSACFSSINSSAKVRYLNGKGADCRAKDNKGKTALFYARRFLRCEDDEVKDVLRYLVIEKGIDINSVDEIGWTPFLCASVLNSSFITIKQLIELGADLSVRDRWKRNALHIAAQSFPSVDKSIIDLLVEKGVDITCQDKNGKTPHQVASDCVTRALLRRHYDDVRFSVFQREMVCSDSIKFCVVGSEMAGKTTYVNSLLQLNQPPPKDDDRTPAVDIHYCENEEIGKGSWWDFGAQPTFHSAHGLFFQQSNTIFSLVLPIRGKISSETLRRLLEEGQFWCAFTKASMRTLSSDEKLRIRLVVIFNLIGVNAEAGFEVRLELEQVAKRLQEKFESTFKVSQVIEMDCSESQSDRMKDCREKLKRIREEMLKTADGVPRLCHGIEKCLSRPDDKRKRSLAYFVTRGEFEKWVANLEAGITLSEDEKKVAIEYLDSSGIIINLGRRVCVRPVWLCRNVIGPLLAPHWFLFGIPREKFGKASKEDIELALRAFESYLRKKGTPSPFVVTADEAIEVLLFLELCIPLEGGKYQITALLSDKMPSDTWNKDSTLDVYRGQRYECADSVDIISPSSFVILQSRCSRMDYVSHIVWKDGIKLKKIAGSKVIECLITMSIKKGHHCIDVIVRWSSKDECEAVAKKFLDELKSMIAAVCDERSPGVILNWFYLDSSHLKKLNADPAIYSSREVDEKVNERALNDKLFSVRPDKDNVCCVRDIIILACEIEFPFSGCFPADDEPVSDALIKACAAVDGSKWEALAIALDISLNDRTDIGEFTRDNFSRMFKVLELWKKQSKSTTVRQFLWWKKLSKSRTVRQLLFWLGEFGISRRAVEEKFKELSGR